MTLLTLGENEWRPLVLVIINCIYKETNRNSLLVAALKGVESIALHFAAAKKRTAILRHALFSEPIRKLLSAQSENSSNIGSVLKDLPRIMLDTVKALHPSHKMKLEENMLENLYSMDVYKSLPLSRFLFLILDNASLDDPSGRRGDGGVRHTYEGSLTLEHILPQVCNYIKIIYKLHFK